MLKPRLRLLATALLGVFLFVTLAPSTFADATSRSEGFYSQTYEISANRLQFNQGAQNGSPSGAYSYSLPLTVPPGRNGLNPQLALSYNSQANDLSGFYGYGWSLDMPSIGRFNKYGVNELYTEEVFSSSLSGELVDTVLDSGAYGDYAAKVESGEFLLYEYKSSGYWTATDKSGTIYTFGSTADTRQDDPSDSTRVNRWMLEEIRDANNNFIRYEYTKDQGQIYPSSIIYTGNGSSDGPFEVNFTLEARADSTKSYSTQFEVITDYRVSQVEMSVNGTWVRRYALGYTTPDDSPRSLLESVTESAQNEAGTVVTLEPTTFSYEESDKGWTETSGYTIPVYFYMDGDHGDKGVDVGDVNGDGLADLLNSGVYSGGVSEQGVYINAGDGTGWFEDSSYSVPVHFWDHSGNMMRNTRMADINGDGASDILYAALESGPLDVREVYLSDEDSSTWTEDTSYSLPARFNDGYLDDKGVRVLDINGDSFPDFVQSLSHGGITQNIYLFDTEAKTWNAVSGISIPVLFNDETGDTDEGVELADVNGDGLVDIVESRYDGSSDTNIYLNRGDGTGWTAESGYTIPVYFWNSGDIMMDQADLVDVNGDGLPDIVYSDDNPSDNGVYINQGNGTGWVEDSAYTVPVQFASGYRSPNGVQIFDVDGDSLPDIVRSEMHGGSTQKVYINNATPELLTSIEHSRGASTTVAYTPSTEFDNPDLPFSMNLVSSITVDDGFGDTSSTTFSYEGGAYYYEDEMNRQFAAFDIITKSESGRVTKTYYHQDSLPKLGRVYKTEIYDESGNLYTRSIDTWATTDLGYDNDFVYKTQSLSMNYDGASSHRDSASAYTYNFNGNIKTVINYGEVTGSLDGSFTDVTTLDEKTTTTYTYAVDGSGGEIRNKVSEEKVTNSSGAIIKRTRYFYDSNTSYGTVSTGNLFRQADWYDTSSTWYNSFYTYNSYGLVATANNRRGYTTSFTYDAYNLYPAITTNPKAFTVSTEYDYSSGQMTSRTDENSITSESTYDGLGRILTVSVPDPTTGVLTTLSTTTYDDTSVPSSVSTTSTVGGVTSESVTYMDGYGRTIQSNTLAEDSLYTTVDTWYDALGNVEEQSLPYSTSSSVFGRDDSQYGVTTTYDPLNRPITVTAPTGSTSYDYSQWENTVTDANGVSKVYNYDAAGHLIQVEEENDGATYTSTYEYDPLGQLITLTDSQGNERNFDYDSLGRKISQEDLHDPAESSFGTWTYTYDQNNNLLTQTDPKGQVITWAYDMLDRVSFEDWDTSTTAREVSYAYDTSTRGRMKLYQISVRGGSTTTADYIDRFQSYDYLGNCTKETHYLLKPGLSTYNYYDIFNTYDLLSRATRTTYPGSMLIINYAYNETGALESIDRGLTGTDFVVSDFDYSPMGQLETTTFANGVTTTNTFDPSQSYRLTNKTTTGTYFDGSTSTSGAIQDLTYTYDSVGNITGIVDASITPTAKTLSYGYDDLNRLMSVSTSGLSAGDYTETYEYDSVGNMTYKSDIGTMLYDGTGASANPHAVTDVNGTAYTYDDNGNLTSNGAHSYTWDKRNRLSSSGSKTFYYNAGGSRYKTVDSSSGSNEYTYTISPLYELRDGTTADDGNPTYYVFAGSQRIAALEDTDLDGNLENSERSYYHQDHLGGTALVTDSTGLVSQVYDYYPYGSELLDSQPTGASVPAEHSFTDKELDDDLGLYYFEARWYSPTIGRFASVDPMDGVSYAYAANNPLIIIDPTGLYNVDTGEIEEGDTQDTITGALSDSLGIEVSWDDVVETGFYNGEGFSFEDGNLEDMVGWTTLADAHTKDATTQLDTLNEMTAEYLEGSSLAEYYEYFRVGGPGDLKTSNYSLFGEGVSGRENWAYIYHGELIRYDAPGSIHAGSVASSLGVSLTSVFFGANVVNFPGDDAYDRSMQAHGYYQTWGNYNSIWQDGW